MSEQSAYPVLSLLLFAAAPLAAITAVIASVMMVSIRRKFGTGMLAAGFRTIATGVFCITAGICIEAVSILLQLHDPIGPVLTLVHYALLAIGIYVIVSGSKNTGDRLESMTK